MDSFFGVGTAELAVILIIAGLVLGPQRIRDVARTLGKFFAQMQAISKEFQSQVNKELDQMEGGEDIQEAYQSIQALREDIGSIRGGLQQGARQLLQEPPTNPPSTPSAPSQPLLPRPIDIPDDPAM